MTEIIYLANLTWPEVNAISRQTPIILPLGDHYNTDEIITALNNPKRIGLLPYMPYGWYTSTISVPINTLEDYVNNLLNSLQDDGFTKVYVLTPKGVVLDCGGRKFSLPNQSPDNNPPPNKLLTTENDKVVLIPVGQIEQHAYHLPLSTDTDIIDAITRSIVTKYPEKSTMIPTMPYGVSTHRKAFVGTFNAGGRAFEDFFISVIDILVERGFTRFYLLSGHGGNCSFLVNVTKYVGERFPWIFCATSWLYLSDSLGTRILTKHRKSPIGGMGHAGELETSLMLYLRPNLVKMDHVIDETNFIATPSYYMDWVEGGSLIANPPWEDDTETGSYGAGSLATIENGRIWFEAAVQEKIIHIEEIHQQYLRRRDRRIKRK